MVSLIAYIANGAFVLLPRIPMVSKILRLRSAWKLNQEIDQKLSAISGESYKIERQILLSSFITIAMVLTTLAGINI